MTAETAGGVLRDGGTAVDAAIAGVGMACACEPVLCSPGGGGFAMVRSGATGGVSVIDFFPHTPIERRQRGADGTREVLADFGTATQAFHIGPATTAAPGFYAGLDALHRWGASAPLADLFAPAVEAARNGVPITPFQHYLSTVVAPILVASEPARKLFAPRGDLLATGESFANPGLADALEVLAQDGFVSGAVGQACVTEQAKDGHLTAADLAAYDAVERTPVSIRVGEAMVHMNPLPAASGTLVAHSIDHLESPDPVDVARAFLATSEARQRANGELTELETLTLRPRGTTHISVIDPHGSACAVSISNGEGNGDLVGDFGFMLNNMLGEEDVNPAGAAGWPVDTRLSSMMCPTMIEGDDGSLVVLGSGGSNRIRSAIGQVVVQLCLNGVDLSQAVTAPRLHVEDTHLDFEDHYADRVRDELCALFPDHRAWPEPNLFFGGVHAARIDAQGEVSGVGDARRDGVAIVVAD